MVTNLVCDESTVDEMSQMCLQGREYFCSLNITTLCDPRTYETELKRICYPFVPSQGFVVGVWCAVISVAGLVGNTLTLLAIPYAKRHQRFGFQQEWDPTTQFIVNLALCDLLYCVVCLPAYAHQHIFGQWRLGTRACFAFAAFRYVTALADWMALGLIALTRCIGLLKPVLCWKIFSGRRGLAANLGVWIWSSAITFSSTTSFGYNCRRGKCDLLIDPATTFVNPHVLSYGAGFLFPFIIILISYLIIWKHVRTSTKILKKAGHADVGDKLNNRDHHMTWTILLICTCYVIFAFPITILNVLGLEATWRKVQLTLFSIYWLQYCINFVIYALRSRQYRKAYWDFLTRALRFFTRRGSSQSGGKKRKMAAFGNGDNDDEDDDEDDVNEEFCNTQDNRSPLDKLRGHTIYWSRGTSHRPSSNVHSSASRAIGVRSGGVVSSSSSCAINLPEASLDVAKKATAMFYLASRAKRKIRGMQQRGSSSVASAVVVNYDSSSALTVYSIPKRPRRNSCCF